MEGSLHEIGLIYKNYNKIYNYYPVYFFIADHSLFMLPLKHQGLKIGLKIQGLFKDSTHCKINRYYDFTCFLLLDAATFLPVAYIFTSGTLESMSDKISYKFQRLSSTDYNLQGLSRP